MQITDVTGLGKPAEILIEKFCNAVGILWEPRQIKRLSRAQAEADVDAERIRALGRLETMQTLTEFQERGLFRRIHEDGIQQENLEKILLGAPNFLGENATPEKLDDDWMRNFSEKAKMTSDEEIQNIWSRILAGEATQPGSFSKRTINLVQTLAKDEAEIFTKLCSFLLKINGEQRLIIFDKDALIYKENSLLFTKLIHLESIGLIQFNWMSSYIITELEKNLVIQYGNIPNKKFWKLSLPENQNILTIGQVILTNIGEELSKITNPEFIAQFPEYIMNEWGKSGITFKELTNY